MAPAEQPPFIEPHSGIRFANVITPPGDTTPQWLAGAGVQQATLFRIDVYAFALYVDYLEEKQMPKCAGNLLRCKHIALQTSA